MVDLTPRSLLRNVGRVGAAAQNALEVARFGGLETGEEASPYEVVADRPVYRLRRYFPALADADLRPGRDAARAAADALHRGLRRLAATSAVVDPARARRRPWVVDFGAPEHEEGGLERNLTDHVLAVSDAVDRVREATGHDVHLGGYSQGGMFCYQAAAYRRGDGHRRSWSTFGSPVDTTRAAAASAFRRRSRRAAPASSPSALRAARACPRG